MTTFIDLLNKFEQETIEYVKACNKMRGEVGAEKRMEKAKRELIEYEARA